MDWLEIAVAADDEAIEAVAEVLRAHGRGVAIEEPFVQPSLEEAPERDFSRRPVVKTYLPDDAAAAEATRRIEEALWHLGQLRAVEPMGVRRIAEEDWANAWKAFFPVLHVGDRTVVVPPWRRYRRPTGGTGADEIIVRLDPGLAFGTGTHPTTRLCLQAVEALITSGQRVLDVGTGSGILAIAAARLGADVVALDVDPLAVTAARANVRRNRVARRVRVSEGSPDALFSTAEGEPSTKSAASFDVILANITARVNAALAPFLAPRLAPAGRLVASGILAESAELVVAAYAQLGLEVAARAQEGDWVALTLARPAPSGR